MTAANQADADRQLGELARTSLHLCVVRMEKGDAWPTAELAAYGPTAAAFIDALRKAQK